MLLAQYHQDNDKYHTSDFIITLSSCYAAKLSYKGWVLMVLYLDGCHKMSPATHFYFQAPTFPTDIPFSMRKIFTYVRFEILQCCLCVSIYAVIIITCSKLCLHSFIYIILNQIRTCPFGFGTPKVHVPQLYYILRSSQLFIFIQHQIIC